MASVAALFALAGYAAGATITTSEPAVAAIGTAQATTVPQVWTSNITGKAFDRFYQIWLENVDYSAAAGDDDQQWLASNGISLTNYYGVGHPSEPNYCAAASGDNYGMDNDDFHIIPSNVSTVADLLNIKGISWGEYQQAQPYAGFQGYNYSNQKTYANDYVRKHNPLVLFDQISSNDTALHLIKNFTDFYEDLDKKQLPQWAFITPNMTNDAHDTNVTFGSHWLRGFVTELMNNTYFWDNTLLLLTFDESETYTLHNRIFSILLGGAVPKDLVGTMDDTVYTHYSSIASVEANWGLPSLGRWDCGANLFKPVAEAVGYINWDVDTTNLYINESLPGPLAQGTYSKYRSNWPVPATEYSCSAGHGILQSVIDTYKGRTPTYNYTAPFPYDAAYGLDAGVTYSRNGKTYISGVNTTATAGYDKSTNTVSSAAASSSTGAASALAIPAAGFLAAVSSAILKFL
ncbi:phosphoesterase-domain-containing protein [Penicillium canescens]|uniref:acid phosphatase n=1 Tax=Penicillium canescens TaxID=5083 RepID=A0AAD6N8B9_PENCN|nr:phosphoesterase-domain-containing protein [Penicillium canescens]KAJ6038432.1 phosphoesterase-domain-containing protein [Penicillium canescens]KAJ6068196.1 phosphoesterase-domain-containing protein [Penicillium canescens]